MKKKVTLLGDSIRLIGYGPLVPQMLGDDYEVFQSEDNCRFAKYTLRCLFDWKDSIAGSHVIHWNNGLWDATELFDDGLFTSESEYVETMLRIARLLKQITPNVIFATTTPTHPDYPYTHNDKIDRFNELLIPRLRAEGILINDLKTLIKSDLENNICEDQIHLSAKGAQIAAEQVCKIIKQFD